MFKGTRTLWPSVSRSVKTLSRPMVILPRIASRHTVSPMHIYRTFTTSIEDASSPQRLADGFEENQLKPMQQQENNNMDWEKYTASISNNEEISAEKFMDISKNIHKDKELGGSEKIKRFQRVLRDLHVRMDEQSDLKPVFVRTCNSLMHVYIEEGNLKNAKLVFEGLADSDCEPSNVSIKTIINGIRQHSTRTDLYTFVQNVEKRGLTWTRDVYESVLFSLKHYSDLRGCQFYFGKMIKEGLEPDKACYKVMMMAYREARRPESVLQLFQAMKEKKMEISTPIYNIVLSSLAVDKKKYKAETDQIFKEMKEVCQEISAAAYLSMQWDPLEAIKDMKDTNKPVTIRDYNNFLAHYVKRNNFPQAFEIYKLIKEDKHVQMDVFSYNIVMDALVKDLERSPQAVFEIYEEMKAHNIEPDAVIYTTLLTACNRAQDLEHAMSLLEEMESFSVKPNEYTFNSILSILSTMVGTTFTDLDRASLIWGKMTALGVHPDTRTYNTYLSIISKLIKPAEFNNNGEDSPSISSSTLWAEDEEDIHVPKTVREMLRMYRYMRRNHHQTIQPDFATYTIVINSLSAAGQLRSAMQVYSDAKMSRVTLPVSAYNEIIRGLQRGGKMSEAMNVWYDMKIFGVLPDSATYEIVLEACEQLGLLEALTSIRNQRKADMNRLLDLDAKKAERMKKTYE